jgi:hypothetical protein
MCPKDESSANGLSSPDQDFTFFSKDLTKASSTSPVAAIPLAFWYAAIAFLVFAPIFPSGLPAS